MAELNKELLADILSEVDEDVVLDLSDSKDEELLEEVIEEVVTLVTEMIDFDIDSEDDDYDDELMDELDSDALDNISISEVGKRMKSDKSAGDLTKAFKLLHLKLKQNKRLKKNHIAKQVKMDEKEY